MRLEPDRDQLEIFIQGMLRHCNADGVVSLRAFFEGDGDKPFRITPTSLKGGLPFLMEAAEDDARRAANDPKPVVFCPPLATFVNRQAREKDLLEAPALSVELDQDPRAALERLEGVLGPATLEVRSGGVWTNPTTGEIEDKLHAHWRLKKPARGKDDIARLKRARALATALVGGDPSNVPPCHPIRWPGSWHRKAKPRLCEIVDCDHLDNEIDLDDALAKLEEIAPVSNPDANIGSNQSAWAEIERHQREANATNGGEAPVDWDKAFADIISGDSFHPTLTPLAASFAARGVPEGAALRALRALLTNTQTTDPARLARRDTELGKLKETVRSGYKKFWAQPKGVELFDPWQPFIVPDLPLDILPPVVRDFVHNQARAIGVDKSAMAMATLAALSGAIHHRFSIKMMRNTDWYEHCRLWVLLVGRPSWKKSPAMDAATRPLERWQAKIMRDYWAAVRDCERNDVKPPDPPVRFVIGDTTSEKAGEILSRSERGVLGKYDEIAGWIGRMERYHGSGKGAFADRAFWLQAWNGGPYSIDRVKGETFVENLSVSILGGIQPTRLHEIHGLSSDGLLQRYLLVLMRAPTHPLDIDCSQSNKNYEALIYDLIALRPQRLGFTDDAVEAMAALQTHLHNLEQVGEALSEGFEGFVGKVKAYAGALAIILHVIENPKELVVGRRVVEKVDRIVRGFLLPHGREFYSQGEGEGERLRKLASYVLTCGRSHLRLADLTTNVRDCRGLTVLAINERVSPLVAGGWLDPADPGPACRNWTVDRNAIDAQFAERTRDERNRKLAIAELIGAPRRSNSDGKGGV